MVMRKTSRHGFADLKFMGWREEAFSDLSWCSASGAGLRVSDYLVDTKNAIGDTATSSRLVDWPV